MLHVILLQRDLYFHIKRKDEVILKKCTDSEDIRLLRPLRGHHSAYFKSDCTQSRSRV